MRTTIEVMNFPGFYETIFDETFIEDEGRTDLEEQYPDFEHLFDWELDSDRYRDAVAKEFAEIYIDELNSNLHINLKLISQDINSPREYNFSTDRIICNIEVDDYDELINHIISLMNEPGYHERLAKIIKKRHSSAPGFWSFMSNDVDEWYDYLKDPDNTNYLECVLWYLYCLKTDESINSENDWDMKYRIYDYIRCNTDIFFLMPATDEAREEYERWRENSQS